MKKLSLSLLLFLFSMGQSVTLLGHFFPSNSEYYGANLKSTSPIDQTKFNQLLKFVENRYQPLFLAMGKKLIIKPHWEDGKVNAYATRDALDNPLIHVHGGIARHPKMTEEGFLAVICHELGHFLGGAPKAFRGRSQRRGWSSAEGQADYFAATKCLKSLFNNEFENRKRILELSETEQETLAKNCHDDQCMRVIKAGYDATRMFASLKLGQSPPHLQYRDQIQVRQTQMAHPSPQCRLDTFVAGALCSVPPNSSFDDNDPHIASCHRKRDGNHGSRPRCWYRPLDSSEEQ